MKSGQAKQDSILSEKEIKYLGSCLESITHVILITSPTVPVMLQCNSQCQDGSLALGLGEVRNQTRKMLKDQSLTAWILVEPAGKAEERAELQNLLGLGALKRLVLIARMRLWWVHAVRTASTGAVLCRGQQGWVPGCFCFGEMTMWSKMPTLCLTTQQIILIFQLLCKISNPCWASAKYVQLLSHYWGECTVQVWIRKFAVLILSEVQTR